MKSTLFKSKNCLMRQNPLFGGLNPWVTLPPDQTPVPAPPGLLRGSLYVDQTGLWDHNLVVVTDRGQMWEVPVPATSDPILRAANTTIFAGFRVGVYLEGLITVPNDPRYGPLAGNLIAGAEGLGKLYMVTPFADNDVTIFDLPVNIEDIDLITPNGNFYGVNRAYPVNSQTY